MPPALAALQIGAVTDREVTRALIALNQSGLAESSVRRFRASLSAFFAWAVRERLIASNPVTTRKAPIPTRIGPSRRRMKISLQVALLRGSAQARTGR